MTTRYQVYTAAICVATGASVLLSWTFEFAPLHFVFGSVAMNPLTAIEFILCGIAMVSPKTLRTGFGALVFLVASIKLLSFVGIDFELDQLLFSERLAQVGAIPNRMAPYTAFNFAFMGLAFLFFDFRVKGSYPLSNLFVIPPILIALTSAIGYLYAAAGLAQVGSFIPIAFNTTLVFLALGFGIFLHHGENGVLGVFLKHNPSARVGRKLLPYVILFPVLLGWLRIQAEHRSIVRPEHGVALMAVGWAVIGTAILWGFVRIINRLEETLEATLKKEAESKLSRLKRFFPPSIAEMIVSGEIEDPFKWRRSDITVTFIDIRGFTPFSEQGEPEEVMRLLQSYYSTVAKIAQKHNGTIGHLAGDGVMIFFNAPVTIENPQMKAVEMALEIRQELSQLWRHFHYSELDLDFGAGIASGYTTIGGIGAEGFWDYTVIGTPTNVASRLCGVARDGQILVSRRFLSSVESSMEAESIGSLELKGIQRPVNVFNITGMKASS